MTLSPQELRTAEVRRDANLDCTPAELEGRRAQREADRQWRESVRRHHRYTDLSPSSKAAMERRAQASFNADSELLFDLRQREQTALRDAAQAEWEAFGGQCTQQQMDAWKERYARLQVGFNKTLNPVIIVPLPKPENSNPPRYLFESVADLRSMAPQRWLVDRWIPERSIGIIYGKWASGKSFIGFDLLLHLAYGMPEWHGVKLPGIPRYVLLIAREGGNGFKGRIDAFKQHHGITDDTDRIVFMRSPVNFGDTNQFDDLKKAIKSTGKSFHVVMVDTIGRALPGEDMFEPKSITRFMEHLQQLGEIADGVAIGVHHENKTGGVMGSAYFENNADWMFHITREGNPENDPLRAGTIACVKQKDGADGWTKAITYKAVADSLVLERLGEPNRAPKGEALSNRQALALRALEDAIRSDGDSLKGVRAVTAEKWKAEMFRRGVLNEESANPRKDYQRIRDALARKAKIVEVDGLIHLRTISALTPVAPLPPTPGK